MHLVARGGHPAHGNSRSHQFDKVPARRFAPGIGTPFAVGHDLGDRLSPPQQDQALTGFNLGDTGGESLVGFAKGNTAHESIDLFD
jgi:hypothetical protein